MKQYNESIKGKLFNYFQGRLNIKQSTKGWWRCNCIDCGGTYTMGIHLEQSKVHCFKCPLDKTPIQVLMDIENFTVYAEARNFLNLQQEYEYYETHSRTKREFKPIELPESFRLLNQGDSLMGKAARHRMTKRGFKVDELAMKGIGYCTSGPYAGYIIFPFYRQGKLIYFQGRLYMGSGPKMKNPSEEEFGIGKSQLIYNQDALYMYDKVYWVESITNAETLGDTAVAGLGKAISPYQLTHLIMSPCEKVVLILDPDAYEDAIKLSLQLVNYKKVKLIKLPGEKDVNDIGKAQTLSFVKKETYRSYNELFRLKLNNGQGTGSGPTSTEHTHYRRGPYAGLGRD